MPRHVVYAVLPLLCLASAGAANDRLLLPTDALFEEGTYLAFSLRGARLDISGRQATPTGGEVGSGDIAPDVADFRASLKTQITDDLAFGLFYTEPYGAEVRYPGDTGYFAAGTRADLDSWAVTPLVKYTHPTNVSVYGGVRYQSLALSAEVPYVGAYSFEADRDGGWGYVLGAAYERPEQALRIGVTYISEITHDLDTTERSQAFRLAGLGDNGRVDGRVEVATPRSITLDAQTGLTASTLLFGSVRWTEWSALDVTPDGFSRLVDPATGGRLGPLLDYQDDTVTYSIGAGQRLTETFGVFSTLTHQPSTGDAKDEVRPIDGFTSLGLGATFTYADFEIEAELRRVWLGDAETRQGAAFDDNTATGIGLRLSYRL